MSAMAGFGELQVQLDDRFSDCKGTHGRCAAACDHTLVYFIQEDVPQGPIKIGHGWRVLDRLRGLQVGNPRPLCLVATMRGGKAAERELHARFKALHIRGEWYRPEPELIAFLESLR